MARYTGPKHKLARREGVNILEKLSPSLERRLNIIPGLHSKRGGRKTSEFGIQLREKQKLKRIYGILEKQFVKYVEHAQRKKGNTTESLIGELERRLDNVVYRLGFAKSRNQARQFVGHGHVLVNEKKVNIPSFLVKEGDIITLSPKLLKKEEFKVFVEENKNLLAFVQRDKLVGKFLRLPSQDEISNPVDYQLVIEFYSR